jgi:uncharacterized protein YjbJ (UPF0337 family)
MHWNEVMNETEKRVEGKADEIQGKIKGAVGEATGDRKLELEGKATELKGDVKQGVAKASESAKGLAGKLKESVTHLFDKKDKPD